MKKQWETYKSLELVPDAVASPQISHSIVVFQLRQVWQSLMKGINNHLVYEQQVHRLEQCWELEIADCNRPVKPNLWNKSWALLNQPILQRGFSTSSEPEIRQIDQGGHIWWYAYDPMTGQKAYLESESEVQIWLEERLYYY
jgi:hypothetical protein